jgi:hypothetical protein
MVLSEYITMDDNLFILTILYTFIKQGCTCYILLWMKTCTNGLYQDLSVAYMYRIE